MASGSATYRQKNSPVEIRAMKGTKVMTTLTPDNPEAGKVLAFADKWVDSRKAVQCAPQDQKARAVGTLKERGKALAAAVDKCRAEQVKLDAGKAGQP